jgi:hypothetical protein
MARPRKTAAQRRQESIDADRRAWEDFLPRLQAVETLIDAYRLVGNAIAPDTPGRRYYSNLGFFIQYFAAPDGANGTELREYLRLVRAFDVEGALKPGVREEVEGKLQAALSRRYVG